MLPFLFMSEIIYWHLRAVSETPRRGSKVVMQRPAKPSTPVRFRPPPPVFLKAPTALFLCCLTMAACPDGEIGRHKRLKISRSKGRAGSIPARGTNQHAVLVIFKALIRFPQNIRFLRKPHFVGKTSLPRRCCTQSGFTFDVVCAEFSSELILSSFIPVSADM